MERLRPALRNLVLAMRYYKQIFVLALDLGNDALSGDGTAAEVARILVDAAGRIESGGLRKINLLDTNGNSVGRAAVETVIVDTRGGNVTGPVSQVN